MKITSKSAPNFFAWLIMAVISCSMASCTALASAPTAIMSSTSTATTSPTETPIPTITTTFAPIVSITPSPLSGTATPRLSPVSVRNNLPIYEINEFTVEHTYCVSPEVFLPTSEAQGFSEDEVARKLMELWLDYFNTSQAPNYCRVDGYRIDKVYYDERTPFLPLEPKGDFIRQVLFSIKLVQFPAFWASWPGEIDKQNWLHTGHNVAVFRSHDRYTMEFANP